MEIKWNTLQVWLMTPPHEEINKLKLVSSLQGESL